MDKKRKEQIISDAYSKYANVIASLKFIEEKDNYYGPHGSDSLSIFRPHNITKVVDEIFHVCDVDYIDDDYRTVIDSWKNELPKDVLFGFKYNGDEHIGYVLESFKETEPVILKSRRLSKNKTEQNKYATIASYNFFTGNVEVNVIDESYIKSLTPLVRAKTPKNFLSDYNDYSNILNMKYCKDTDDNLIDRDEVITITAGQWSDVLSEIRKLKERIDEMDKDLRDNYTRRHNSLED